MTEKRKTKRFPVSLSLRVSTLGFVSDSVLPVGYYFNAALHLGNKDDTLYCVIKIIRSIRKEDGSYSYGAEFVGMAPVLNYIFDEI